jgi:hypothetical protein
MGPLARSVTKSISIDRAPQDVFDFLADPANWPQWAIVNTQSIAKSDDTGWWDMVTRHGRVRLHMRSNAEYGILDHDYQDKEAMWAVAARVIANRRGSEFLITLLQPDAFSNDFFDLQVRLVDLELAELKRVLEQV